MSFFSDSHLKKLPLSFAFASGDADLHIRLVPSFNIVVEEVDCILRITPLCTEA